MLLLCFILCSSLSFAAGEHEELFTGAAHCLNNEIIDLDFKIDNLKFESEATSFVAEKGVEKDETCSFINNNPEKSYSGIAETSSETKVAKAFLIEHDILHRPANLVWDTNHYVASLVENDEDGWCSDNSVALKSDLLLMLSKIEWGVQPSRTLILENSSVRNTSSGVTAGTNYWSNGTSRTFAENYWGTGVDANFAKGDFYFYVDPNVYELYFKKLLDAGIIKKSDFSNGKFISDYENSSTDYKPAWLDDSVISGKIDNALGQSISFNNEEITHEKPDYFGEGEQLTTLEALRLLETFMRITEKDISDTEASIVTYKYGINYLSKFTEEDQRTLSFLIAKGILNYDIDNFGLNLFRNITYAQLYELVYRVANADARLDFSQIQLTDSENFWYAKGFCEESISVYSVDEPPVMRTVSAEVVTTQGKSLFSPVYAASTTLKTYRIIKQFDKVNEYFYRGATLADLQAALKAASVGALDGEIVFEELKSITDKTVNVNGSDVDVYEVVFEYKATSKESAINYIDSNFTSKITSKEIYSISAVTKISVVDANNGDTSTTRMVSQDVLRECFKDIAIIEDKVLYNKRTGEQAVFLPESGYALVGKRVFSNSSLLITDTNNTVYYNLSVIMSLLANSDLEELGKGSIFIWDLIDEKEARVYSATGGYIGSAYYIGAIYSPGDGPEDTTLSILDGDDIGDAETYLYKLDNITNGISTIYRKFTVNFEGQDCDIHVIVDWVFAAPDSTELNSYKMLQTDSVNGDLTMNDALLALYTRPQDPVLGEWWDSNLGMSNALANFIYGTRGVEYVKSGYLAPSLTILVEDVENVHLNMTTVLNNFFTSRGFYLPSKYSKYVGNTTQNFWVSYFENQLGCPDELKALANVTRNCQVLIGYDFEGDGYSYGTSFFVAKNGVVYRNFDDDGRLSLDTTTSPAGITVQDRVDGEETPPLGGSIWTEDGKYNWKFVGMAEINGKLYLQLYPLFDIIGKEDANGDSITMDYSVPTYKSSKSSGKISWKHVQTNGMTLKEEMYNLYSKFFPEFTNYTSLLGDWNSTRFNFEHFSSDFIASSDSKILMHSTSAATGLRTTFYYTGGTGNWKKYDATSGLTAYAVPRFFLPASDFYAYKDGDKWVLGKGALPALLTKSNYFYSGLNNSIMEAMIAKSVGVSSVKVLPYGSEFLIGNTVWTKKGDYWESNPIYDGRAVAEAMRNDPQRYQEMMSHVFEGMVVYCDDFAFNITNYFQCVGLAPVTEADSLGENSCACLDPNGSPAIYKKGDYTLLPTGGIATALCIRMKIDESFLARPIDDTGKRWVACYSASESLVNGLEIPFFSESLSYDNGGLSRVTLGESYYQMTGMFNEKKDKSNAAYKTLFIQDFISLFMMIVICLVSYLAVMGFIAYFMLTQGMGRYFLEALVTKTENGRFNGIDIIKIMTFGIYRLDNDPSLLRVIVTGLICFVIASFCLGHL